MRNPPTAIFEFEGFRLDSVGRSFSKGGNVEIPLTPRVFDTLLYLVRNRGRVIEKDEFMRAVWPDSFVEENNLNKNISLLRRTLGEKPGEDRFISTVPGRGYVFVAKIHETNVEAAHPEPKLIAVRHEYEQHGNVVAIREWANFPAKADEEVAAEQKAHMPSRSYRRPIIFASYIFGVALLLSVIAVATSRWSSEQPRRPDLSDLRRTNITNGQSVISPVISPDGRFFAYHETDGQTYRMWLQQSGQPGRVEVIPAGETVIGEKTFSPDGRYIYFLARPAAAERSSLYRVPVIGGIHSRIVEDAGSPASFSPTGEKIAFSRYDPATGRSTLHIANADGSGEYQMTSVSHFTALSYPAWSPDGEKIAFVAKGGQQEGGSYTNILVTADAHDKSPPAVVPGSWDTAYRLAWTRGGTGLVLVGTRASELFTSRRDQIWFVSIADGWTTRLSSEGWRHDFGGVADDNSILIVPDNRASQVWAMDQNGDASTAVKLTDGTGDGRGGIVPAADGGLRYISWFGDSLEIWAADPDGANQRRIFSGFSGVEALTAVPGRDLYVFSGRKTDAGNSGLFLVDGREGIPRPLTSERLVLHSTVSPDGKTLVYSNIVPNSGIHQAWLETMPVEGGEATLLTDKGSRAHAPHFSPDGRYISYIRPTDIGTAEIKVMMANGGPPVMSFDPRAEGNNYHSLMYVGAKWHPDGEHVAYIHQASGVANIWLQPINGGSPTQLTNFTSGMIYNFAFAPDGKRLFLARGYPTRDAVLITGLKE